MKNIEIKRKNRSNLTPYLLLAPAMILVLSVMGYPMIDSIRISFLDYSLLAPNDIEFIGFGNYVKLFNDSDLFNVFLNSIKWVVSVVSIQFLIGFLLALLLTRHFRGKKFYQSVVFLPWAVPVFLAGLMFKWIFSESNGILNYFLTSLGMIDEAVSWLGNSKLSMSGPITAMIWYGIPFFGIMILAALQSIPQDVYDAAKIDGSNAVQQLFYVTLPYIKPTIITTLLLRVIWVFNSPDIIHTMTGGGPANSSNILTLYVFNQAFYSLDFGY
ncbi:MAG: sugar ABC transporter permease [Clostridia bacterium]|nr:sugar ABC transporter permease [Clostridia bacterium]